MSIADKITALSQAKDDITSAIVDRGGTVSGGFSSFADDISNLPTGGGGHNLPDEYQEVESVTFNNGYIDTDFNPSNNDVEYAFTIGGKKNYGPHILSSDNVFYPFFRGTTSYGTTIERLTVKGSSEININKPYYTNKTYIIKTDISNNKVYVNDEETDVSFPNMTDIYPLRIGGYHKSASSDFTLYGHIYYVIIYDNNHNEIKHFVPCYRKNDYACGMYDIVEDKFYTGFNIIAGKEVTV